jgi:hypothetical protein
LSKKEIYIDAHKNVFPCCFLASAPYNHSNSQSIVADIRQQILAQYYELVTDLGGIESLNAVDRSIKNIINDDRWQQVWEPYWTDKKLITCARVCGVNALSKPNDQFVTRVTN